MIIILFLLGIVALTVVTTAILREGEWERFKDNNRKQPKDDELPKE